MSEYSGPDYAEFKALITVTNSKSPPTDIRGRALRGIFTQLRFDWLVGVLPALLVPEQDLALPVGLDREIDHNDCLRARFDIQVRRFTAVHALDEVVDVGLHHVG